MSGHTSKPASVSISAGAKGPTLQTFHLDDLAQYTAEGAFATSRSADFRVFYAGRDDVHGVLHHLLSRATVSLRLNMFGYDDDELNRLIMALLKDPKVFVQATLDQSQAAGAHEKAIISADETQDAAGFANSFVIGQSATHQISHTKGGVLDGIVAFEGSTNWSASGEGTGIGLHGAANAAGYKAQNNTLTVYTSPYEIAKFAAELDHEHAVAKAQGKAA
jgi:hypothetical protein